MAARLQVHFRSLAPMFVQSKHLPHTCPAFLHPRRSLHLPGPPCGSHLTSCYSSCLSSSLQATSRSLVATAGHKIVGHALRGGYSIQRSLRYTATKASKSKTKFCCSSCGHDTFQYFGKCPSCGEFGTYVTLTLFPTLLPLRPWFSATCLLYE